MIILTKQLIHALRTSSNRSSLTHCFKSSKKIYSSCTTSWLFGPCLFVFSAQKTQNKEDQTSAVENIKRLSLEERLVEYQKYLLIHNTHSKKAHEKLVTNEDSLIGDLIKAQNSQLIRKFLSDNIKNRIASVNTIPSVIAFYSSQSVWNNVLSDLSQKINVTALMVEYGEFSLFDKLVEHLRSSIGFDCQSNQLFDRIYSQISKAEDRFHFVHCWILRQKDHPFDSKFVKSLLDEPHSSAKSSEIRKFFEIYWIVLQQKQKGNLIQKETKALKQTKRSNLQKEVDCLLNTLTYKNLERQVIIGGNMIDFVLGPIENSKIAALKERRTILEVMGNYHYTIIKKLKAKDLRKIKILSVHYNVKLVHHWDLNMTKGMRNRIAYLRHLIEEIPSTNYSPELRGFHSDWVLKEHYDELK